MSRGDVEFLKNKLKGPILEEIIDPADYPTDDIMKSYFREILFLAGRYVRPTVDYEDLVGEGIIGLLDAIRRFDISKAKGNPRAFHNLAIVRIKSNMFEFFLANNTQYTIPNYMSRAMNLLEQIRNIINGSNYQGNVQEALLNFYCEDFEKGTPSMVVNKVNVVKDKLQRLASNSGKSYEGMVLTVLKVERDIESYESDKGGTEVSPEEIAGDREYMSKFLENLNPDARAVITMVLEGKTLEQAGKERGFSRERARQIREDTMKYFTRTPLYKEYVEEKQQRSPQRER